MTKKDLLTFLGAYDLVSDPSPSGMDADIQNGVLIPAVARVTFKDAESVAILKMTVYENKTFAIGQAACGMCASALAAYGRANEMVEVLGLKDR